MHADEKSCEAIAPRKATEQREATSSGGRGGPSGSPADFGRLIVDETEKWGKAVRALNRRVAIFRNAADQPVGARRIPLFHRTLVRAVASPSQPEGQVRMGADHKARRRLAPSAKDPSSLAECALRRQTLKIESRMREICSYGSARGRLETAVPTANIPGCDGPPVLDRAARACPGLWECANFQPRRTSALRARRGIGL
jgi:hypothetical protein